MDGGSALFRLPVPSPDSSERAKLREQASLIASSLARMGVGAANAGRYDLAEGPQFLTSLASSSGLPYVSANLRDKTGNLLFPPARTLTWGGRRAFVFGLTRPEPNLDPTLGFSVDEPIKAAKALLGSADPEEIVICLTDLGYTDEHELARQVPRINLIVGGGEGTKLLQSPIPIGSALLLRSADRGRELGAFTLRAPAKGWVKPVRREEGPPLAAGLEALRADAVSKGATFDPGLFAELSADAKKVEGASATFENRIVLLDSSVPDEPAIGKAVNAFSAKWAGVPKPVSLAPPKVSPPVRAPSPPKVEPPPSGPASSGDTRSCRRCHPQAFERWLKTPHSSTLARLPAEGRSNSACLQCHMAKATVGTREVGEPMVGCQACHGAGAGHPGSVKVRRSVEEKVCVRCHRNEHSNAPFDFRKGFEAVRCDAK